MENLRVEGYKTIVPNFVWGRPAEPILDAFGQEHQSTEVIQITRFHVPTSQEVIDYGIEKARSFIKGNDDKSSMMHTFLSKFDRPSLRRMANPMPEFRESLAERDTAIDLTISKRYVKFSQGKVLNNLLSDIKNAPEDYIIRFHHSVLFEYGDPYTDIMLQVKPDGNLLSDTLIKTLLECEVYSSGPLCVKTSRNEGYDIVRNGVNLLCNLLNSPEKVDSLMDGTKNVLDSRFCHMVTQYATQSAQQVAD